MPTFGTHNPWAMLHIPKTGSTWCATVLHGAGLGDYAPGWSKERAHMPTTRFRVEHPVSTQEPYDVAGRFTFAFVRHPVTWYGSMWAYMTHYRRWRSPGWPSLRIVGIGGTAPRYDEWVRQMTIERPGFVSSLYRQFVGPVGGEIEYIGRFENLRHDLMRAMELVGEKLTAEVVDAYGPVNIVGQRPRWRSEWSTDRESQRLIEESEREAIERFRY